MPSSCKMGEWFDSSRSKAGMGGWVVVAQLLSFIWLFSTDGFEPDDCMAVLMYNISKGFGGVPVVLTLQLKVSNFVPLCSFSVLCGEA
ncbi:hypothetical protein N658DRAFT_25623 [Parathielavia hyrcaniae]|uniref:Uncharacterized protein n=1 Tax=Parathielavia hyrcaniae TaxID=113614 RepID=A0AAN6QBQ7_9PEZI|nr:hypothetical protein N658DRAFT_25623 [Parathielavia hyrcaniae]